MINLKQIPFDSLLWTKFINSEIFLKFALSINKKIMEWQFLNRIESVDF